MWEYRGSNAFFFIFNLLPSSEYSMLFLLNSADSKSLIFRGLVGLSTIGFNFVFDLILTASRDSQIKGLTSLRGSKLRSLVCKRVDSCDYLSQCRVSFEKLSLDMAASVSVVITILARLISKFNEFCS